MAVLVCHFRNYSLRWLVSRRGQRFQLVKARFILVFFLFTILFSKPCSVEIGGVPSNDFGTQTSNSEGRCADTKGEVGGATGGR